MSTNAVEGSELVYFFATFEWVHPHTALNHAEAEVFDFFLERQAHVVLFNRNIEHHHAPFAIPAGRVGEFKVQKFMQAKKFLSGNRRFEKSLEVNISSALKIEQTVIRLLAAIFRNFSEFNKKVNGFSKCTCTRNSISGVRKKLK